MAASRSSLQLTQELLASGQRAHASGPSHANTALIVAGSPETLDVLLEAGARPSHQEAADVSPLGRSVRHGSVDIVRSLLAHGVTTDSRASREAYRVIAAVQARQGEVLNVLLRAGADPNIADDQGRSALMIAARGGDDRVVQALIDQGANVDALDVARRSALWYAAATESPPAVQLLLACKALADAADSLGNTPLMAAISAGLRSGRSRHGRKGD